MLLIKENSDPDDGAAGGQDILAMTIIGWLFAHHGLMQTERSIDALILFITSSSDPWRIQDNPGPPEVECHSQPPLIGVI
jgi:hypothetical protein